MFISSFICKGLEFWKHTVKHILIYKNYDSKVFKNIKFSGEIFNNWPKYLLETNVFKTLDLCS